MDYEKLYKEALERVEQMVADAQVHQEVIEQYFPELKESREKKIRKSLIMLLQHFCKGYRVPGLDFPVPYNDMLDWIKKQGEPNTFSIPQTPIKDTIEVTSRMQYISDDMKPIAEFIMDYAHWDLHKDEWSQPTLTVPLFRVLDALIQRGNPYGGCSKCQEEQELKPQGKSILEVNKEEKVDNNICKKPTDKAEPKFKVGQWIVWQNKCYKVNYNGCGYELVEQNGLSTSLEYGTIDKNAHIWNIIKDAKDGDVLASKITSCVLIFKGRDGTSFISYYNTSHNYNGDWNNDSFFPATKEQREFLFAKMKKDGYKWDANNKQLIKL